MNNITLEATPAPASAPAPEAAATHAEPSMRAGFVAAGTLMVGEAIAKLTHPKPKRQKTTKTLIIEDGVWKPFRIWPQRERISEARKQYAEASDRVDELQLEAERTKASLDFLRTQVADGERRLKALGIARMRASEEAQKQLRIMAEDY